MLHGTAQCTAQPDIAKVVTVQLEQALQIRLTMLLSLACQDLTNFGKVHLGLQLMVCPAQHDMAYHSTACAACSYPCPAQQAPPQCTLPLIHNSSSSSMPLLPCQGQEIMLPSLPTFLFHPHTPDGQQLLLLLLLAALMVYMSCPGLYHMPQGCKIPASRREQFMCLHPDGSLWLQIRGSLVKAAQSNVLFCMWTALMFR